jgi:alkaline phosphatase D
MPRGSTMPYGASQPVAEALAHRIGSSPDRGGPISPYTRRRFLTTGASLGVASVLAPEALTGALAGPRARLFRSGSFPDGVLSGDPTPTGITLWTRLAEVEGRGTIRLEVARDRGFRRLVAAENVATSGSRNHTAKARVRGLDPGERYYYRFETRGSNSPVGRFQTALPADSRDPVRFGVFSCQEFTFGFYNAHALMAREDIDFVVNLGDYVYSDVAFGPPTGVRDANYMTSGGRFSAATLDEYRQLYQVVRRDRDLRRLHARFPMISCWDDHEVQNDYSGGDPSGGAVTGDPYSIRRRNIGYRAFFEQMPTFPVGRDRFRLYHRARFGRAVDLYVLDERQYRAADPCGNRAGPPCPELNDPRAFLGRSQSSFVRGGIRRSDATWKVIANQVVMMPIKLNDTDYDAFDAWQGFPVEREALLRTVADVDGVVFVTGDYHAFIAGDVQTAAGRTVAAEFVGGSVSSATEPEVRAITRMPGYGTPDDPRMPPDEQARRMAANPWYDELDYEHHGYFVCEASRSEFNATFKKLATVRRLSRELAGERSWTIRRGQRGLDA